MGDIASDIAQLRRPSFQVLRGVAQLLLLAHNFGQDQSWCRADQRLTLHERCAAAPIPRAQSQPQP